MNSIDTVAKTAAGAEELKTRSRGLSQRLRMVLIMADGVQTVEQVRSAAAGLGLPADFLHALVADGLIEIRPSRGAPGRSAARPSPVSPGAASRPAPLTSVDIPTGPVTGSPASTLDAAPAGTEAERFLRARQFMNDRVVEALGLRAFFFILKLEKCSTRAELAELLPDFGKAVAKSGDLDAANASVARTRDLLR